MDRTETGRLGEDFVCRYLAERGFTISARNYRIKGGEIDIVAKDDEFIIFVEVKTRKPNSLSSGFDAIDKRKKGLIIKTASDYCQKYVTELQPRFDIAEVTAAGGRVIGIEYIPDAFDATGFDFYF